MPKSIADQLIMLSDRPGTALEMSENMTQLSLGNPTQLHTAETASTCDESPRIVADQERGLHTEETASTTSSEKTEIYDEFLIIEDPGTYCCQCLTRYDCSSKFGMRNHTFPFFQAACDPCKVRNRNWIWVGCVIKDKKALEWKRLHPESGTLIEQPDLDASNMNIKDIPNLCGLAFSKTICYVPLWVSQLTLLEDLDLSFCSDLEALPLGYLLDLPLLKNLACQGCKLLNYPPLEVCNQLGKEVMIFLRQVRACGQYSKSMNICLVGDAEAGKTSTIKALKSKDSRANHIRTDARTVGVDITTWETELPDVSFKFWDFAGQAEYSKTHQLIIFKRAVYIFVWRAGSSNLGTLKQNVRSWMGSLQNKIPGFYMMIVVTHIDEVDKSMLDEQCMEVKHSVHLWLETIAASSFENGIQYKRPNIWDNGQSIQVNCLSGDGIDLLKSCLINFTKTMPWYMEALPSSWIQLQENLQQLCTDEGGKRSYLDWKSYVQVSAKCGIHDNMVRSATKFFHDSGVIRYFGDIAKAGESLNILDDTVFISPCWMANIMKGLIRHDRQALLDFFVQKRNKVFLRHTNRLNVCGILHKDLISFLWPSSPESQEFWDFVRNKSEREWELWRDDIILYPGDVERAIAVLEGFDLVARIGEDLIAPGVLPPAALPSRPILDVPNCPFRVEFRYSSLPPGAFESIVVQSAKQFPTEFEFSAVAATFYDDQGHISQVITYTDNEVDCLILRSSSEIMMKHLERSIDKLEQHFAGLIRLERNENFADANTLKTSSAAGNGHRFQLSLQVACFFCEFSNSRAFTFDKSNVKASIQAKGTVFSAAGSDDLVSCPNCQNQIPLIDILTTFRVPDSCDCPVCIEIGEKNPGQFSRGECRLRFNHHSCNDVITTSCFTCLANGRTGQICVDCVAPPEVYVSGLCLLDPNMQYIIMNWLKLIELEADVRCCYSINACNESENTGFEEAMFVLILVSDANPLPAHTSQAVWDITKRRIHILLPQWTGLRGQDLWKQGSVGLNSSGDSDPQDSSTKADSDFMHVSVFPSMDDLDSMVGLDVLLAHDVAEDITQHLQRPGCLEIYSDFSMLGIKLSFLDCIIENNGGRSALKEYTTEQFMEDFVKPATRESRLSFCEQLKSEGRTDVVGTAEWFYSHVWKFRFIEVVDAAKRFFAVTGPDRGDPFLWFDIFSVSQHKASIRPFEWWNRAFFNAIGLIGRVLMLMQPFEDQRTETPAWTPLTRVWCVFEMYACESTLGRFEVTMTNDMAERFRNALIGNDDRFLSFLVSTDCKESDAFKPEDKESVFRVIEKTIGFPLLNSLVVKILEKWIYSELLQRMKEAESFDEHMSYLDTMESLCKLCLDDRKKKLGIEHSDTKMTVQTLKCIGNAKHDPAYLKHLISLNPDAISMEAQRLLKAADEKAAKKIEVTAKNTQMEGESCMERKVLLEVEAKARRKSEARERRALKMTEKCKELMRDIETGTVNERFEAAQQLMQKKHLLEMARLLNSDDASVQTMVARVFEKLETAENNLQDICKCGAIHLLVEMLDSDVKDVMRSAVRALQKLCASQSIRDVVGPKKYQLVLQVHSKCVCMCACASIYLRARARAGLRAC